MLAWATQGLKKKKPSHTFLLNCPFSWWGGLGGCSLSYPKAPCLFLISEIPTARSVLTPPPAV